MSIKENDYLIVGTTNDGNRVAISLSGSKNPPTTPYILPAGTGSDAETSTWDINNPPEGTDGVRFKNFRLYWSGNSGDSVYQFIRKLTYNSSGSLVYIDVEERSVAFSTGSCRE